MSVFHSFCRAFLSLLLVFAAIATVSPTPGHARDNNIAAELLLESPPVPGGQMTLAIQFTPKPGWHGYWKNPGDAGYGMELDWELPTGWVAGEPLYPVPHRLLIGGLMNHVYKGSYTVLIPLKVPLGLPKQEQSRVAVEAQWLACTDVICVPERATLTTSLAPRDVAADSARFAEWQAAIPPQIDGEGSFQTTRQSLRLAIPLPASLNLPDPHIYLADRDIISYSAEQQFSREGDLLIAEIPLNLRGNLPREIEGILAFGDKEGVRFDAVNGPVPAAGVPVAGALGATPPLYVLLLGALAGGLLLNIMPCVFPILSLKALSLARAGSSQAEARREGIAYSAGVILATISLGGLLLVLRAAGEQVGWAFQLQEPSVVVFMAVLASAITANLAGLFQLPSVSITRRGEPASAFATGLLAAVVATPCTGPFMAAALGAALLLPAAQALILFATLGLGIALPFLLIGFIPALRRLLPKPGPWMEHFRKAMAIPMGLTVAALLWLVWRIGGDLFVLLTIGVIVALIGAMPFIRAPNRKGRRLAVAALASGVLLVASLPVSFQSPSARTQVSILDPVNFSEKNLAEARASGRPVFLWFTADWCLTCKVNERLAIERDSTRAAFERAGVIAIRGDWTKPDPEIAGFLTRQGAAGIPLYIWYAPDGSVRQLDQVLGPDSLTDLAEGT